MINDNKFKKMWKEAVMVGTDNFLDFVNFYIFYKSPSVV
jgi:hypothetical protein